MLFYSLNFKSKFKLLVDLKNFCLFRIIICSKIVNCIFCRLEATNQLLRDEHQALHLAYTALEEKHHRLMLENKEVVQRYIEIKAQHADFMNQENENFVKYVVIHASLLS